MPHPTHAVLFDLDGVLVDSSLYHRMALERLGDELGVPVTEAFHRATFGTRTRETLIALLNPIPSDAELDRLIERKEALYRECARGRIDPLPGAVELVRGLRAAGVALAIGSSTVLANVELALREIGVLDSFDAIVAGEDVSIGKPDPEVFLTAARKVEVPPERCVVIEDAPQGVEAARRGGMRVVAVASSRDAAELVGADRVVASLSDLSPDDLIRLVA
ncbi:HAD family phosphatase [Candidatus Poribacteria bacterium]|nr:HAD family phosphatase [Candidatus Poribacteria bacterium]